MPTPIERLESLGHFHCIEPVSGVRHAHFYCWSQDQKIFPTLMAKCNFVTFNFVLTESLIVTKPFDFFVINLN